MTALEILQLLGKHKSMCVFFALNVSQVTGLVHLEIICLSEWNDIGISATSMNGIGDNTACLHFQYVS